MGIPDPRTYDDVSAVGGDSGGFTPLTAIGSDLYGRVVKSTPGLVHLWRFAAGLASLNGGAITTYAPYFLNSAGAPILGKFAGAPTHDSTVLVTGGEGSVRLHNGSLWAFDYFTNPGAHEVGSFEAWVHPLSLPTDSAIFGQWGGGAGWVMLLDSTGKVTFSIGGQSPLASAGGAIAIGSTYHIVAVVGGTQVPDYHSRLYINGAEVDNGDYNANQQIYTQNDQLRIGSYAGGAGTAWDAYISELAIYSRMLQPDEVYQHYQAGIGVLWP